MKQLRLCTSFFFICAALASAPVVASVIARSERASDVSVKLTPSCQSLIMNGVGDPSAALEKLVTALTEAAKDVVILSHQSSLNIEVRVDKENFQVVFSSPQGFAIRPLISAIPKAALDELTLLSLAVAPEALVIRFPIQLIHLQTPRVYTDAKTLTHENATRVWLKELASGRQWVPVQLGETVYTEGQRGTVLDIGEDVSTVLLDSGEIKIVLLENLGLLEESYQDILIGDGFFHNNGPTRVLAVSWSGLITLVTLDQPVRVFGDIPYRELQPSMRIRALKAPPSSRIEVPGDFYILMRQWARNPSEIKRVHVAFDSSVPEDTARAQLLGAGFRGTLEIITLEHDGHAFRAEIFADHNAITKLRGSSFVRSAIPVADPPGDAPF